MKYPLFILIACFSTFFCPAQEDTVKQKIKISLSDLSFLWGTVLEKSSYGSMDDIKTLAPQSVLLPSDLISYSETDGEVITGRSLFSILLGIHLGAEESASNNHARLGLKLFHGSNLNGSFKKENRFAFDTLISAQTGKEIYLDSVISERYSWDYSSEQIRLDASMIFGTDPENRWTLFTGLGLSAGWSINARTDIFYIRDEKVTSNDEENYSRTVILEKNETLENKTNFGFSAYIPLGIDLRLGKKRELWKKTHLFMEFRPGLTFTTVPGLRTFNRLSLQQAFGAKFML